MEKIKSVFFMLFVLMGTVSLSSSCDNGSDSSDENDLASKIAGNYVGKLSSGGKVIEDAYVVSVIRISNTTVSVSAAFQNPSSQNYNVEYTSGQYKLVNSMKANMTYIITGKHLNVSFVNRNNSMTTFDGDRD